MDQHGPTPAKTPTTHRLPTDYPATQLHTRRKITGRLRQNADGRTDSHLAQTERQVTSSAKLSHKSEIYPSECVTSGAFIARVLLELGYRGETQYEVAV